MLNALYLSSFLTEQHWMCLMALQCILLLVCKGSPSAPLRCEVRQACLSELSNPLLLQWLGCPSRHPLQGYVRDGLAWQKWVAHPSV